MRGRVRSVESLLRNRRSVGNKSSIVSGRNRETSCLVKYSSSEPYSGATRHSVAQTDFGLVGDTDKRERFVKLGLSCLVIVRRSGTPMRREARCRSTHPLQPISDASLYRASSTDFLPATRKDKHNHQHKHKHKHTNRPLRAYGNGRVRRAINASRLPSDDVVPNRALILCFASLKRYPGFPRLLDSARPLSIE
jgi:hypothetical protein